MRRTILIIVGLWALLVVLALAGPALIDWSRYKEIIATRLEQATGRDVDIAGPVGLRLLPSPAFSANQVTIGTVPGAGDQPMATVERLDIRLRWLPLLTGTVEITSLDLDRPALHLVQLADGRTNWKFSAREDAPGSDAAPAQGRPTLKGEPSPAAQQNTFSIDQATIRNGVVTFQSGDAKPIRLDSIGSRVAIGSASGPFSAEGQASHSGTPIRFDIAIDRISPGRGSPLSAALSLPDGAAKLDFAGILSQLSEGETLNGRLTIAAPNAARALAALGVTAIPAPLAASLAAETTIAVKREEITAKDLVISLGDTRLAGTVTAALGETPQIDADLRVAAFDLDKWNKSSPATSEPRAKPSDAATPSAAKSDAVATPAPRDTGFSLPDTLFAHVTLVADTLAWRGEVVRDTHLDATLAEGEVAVHRVAGQLPGGSTFSGEGSLSAAKGRPVFDGSIKLGSDNPRALLAWLGSDTDALPPGRLTLATPLKVTWPEISLADLRLSIGDDALHGRVKARLEQPLAFDLAADTQKWGEVTANGTLEGDALDATVQALGLNATAKGILGDQPNLALVARHPDIARLLRHLAPGYRPRGPLGALALNARITGDAKVWDIAGLSLEAGALRLTGSARANLTGAKPNISADLTGNDLALDPYLSVERTGFLLPGGPRLPPTLAPPPIAILPAAAGGAGSAPWSRDPLDLAALQGFNARIGLTASSVSAKDWRLGNAAAKLVVQDGGALIEQLTGQLLGGDFSLLATLTGGTVPGLKGQFSVAGADVGAVKPGAGGVAVTQGRLDAEARFATHGRSSFDMASRLAGDGRLLVKDGIVTGFDLPAVNQRLNNLENVGSLLGLVQSGLTGGTTRFSALSGTLQAKDGVVATRDLKLDAQGGGATAESSTDLARWTTATTIAIRLADSTAPPLLVRLEGPLGNPRKVIDINAVQQYLVARGLGRALKGKDGGLVETLLGGKRPPPPEGSQAQPSDQPPAEKPNGARVLRDLLKGLGGR